MTSNFTQYCFYFLLLFFLLSGCGKPDTLWTFKQIKEQNFQEVRYFYDQKSNSIGGEPDRFPMYPGGSSAFLDDLETMIRYTTADKREKNQGQVIAKYVINREGRIRKVSILQSLSPGLDRAVIKGLRTLKKRWFPAVINGNAVEVTFIQTFDFSLR
ncbi:MAG: energy transducer TonB [Saprospiraceae bacterium]|nr:energy transducer TonB [Saprospiraceae bacterium]